MEERADKNNLAIKDEDSDEEYRGVALGICFGSGIGIVLGAILNYVGMGLSLGAVIGVLAGAYCDSVRKRKKRVQNL